jgi:hypothetical protein
MSLEGIVRLHDAHVDVVRLDRHVLEPHLETGSLLCQPS